MAHSARHVCVGMSYGRRMAPVLDMPHLAGLLIELVGSTERVYLFIVPACMTLGHALGVLMDRAAARTRRWRAAGLVVGVAVTILVVLVDLILEGG